MNSRLEARLKDSFKKIMMVFVTLSSTEVVVEVNGLKN